jgi:hypothetical protein
MNNRGGLTLIKEPLLRKASFISNTITNLIKLLFKRFPPLRATSSLKRIRIQKRNISHETIYTP